MARFLLLKRARAGKGASIMSGFLKVVASIFMVLGTLTFIRFDPVGAFLGFKTEFLNLVIVGAIFLGIGLMLLAMGGILARLEKSTPIEVPARETKAKSKEEKGVIQQ